MEKGKSGTTVGFDGEVLKEKTLTRISENPFLFLSSSTSLFLSSASPLYNWQILKY